MACGKSGIIISAFRRILFQKKLKLTNLQHRMHCKCNYANMPSIICSSGRLRMESSKYEQNRRSYSTNKEKHMNNKIPAEPTWKPIDPHQLPQVSAIDDETIDHLERLSLVNFSNQAAHERLTRAVQLANQLQLVDTTGVEPMTSILEDRTLYLREDKVTEGNCTEDILRNSKETLEEYFVAPPGNIPLPKKSSEGPDG